MSAANRADNRRIFSRMQPFGILADDLGGDVDLMLAEVDEAAVPRERPAAEAASVVADEVERTESEDKATDHAFARSDDGSHPNGNSGQRHC